AVETVVEFDSITLLMEALIKSMEIGCQMVADGSKTESAEAISRAKKIAMQLRVTAATEVDDQFSVELSELILSVEQLLQQAQVQMRVVPLRMAINIVTQIAMIWRQGVMNYLKQSSQSQLNEEAISVDLSHDYLSKTMFPEERVSVIH
ncbi:MAG: hypothetical protein HN929_09010, partial [Chloroflexi bacterium]|nr:hypothetical protein [Chloroflexota bacterium]